jgi:hypothetical protein
MPIVVDYAVEKRPIEVSSIIKRAGLTLNDEDHLRWTIEELLEWINEGTGAIVSARPSAGARIVAFPLSAGTQQEIPDDVVQLIDVIMNVSDEGAVPGRAIRKTERHLLDSADPDWHIRPGKPVIKHYTYDDRTPAIFHVYPPALANTWVKVAYSKIPDDVSGADDTIGLNVEFADALLNYVLYRCYSKDSEFSNAGVANAFYQAFTASMGNNAAGEQSTTPTNKVPA